MKSIRRSIFNVIFLSLLAFCLAGTSTVKADETLDLAWYWGFVDKEKGTDINDGLWSEYRVHGRINPPEGDWDGYFQEAVDVFFILELDSERNLLAEVWGGYNGEFELWNAALFEVQDQHVIFHGDYDFEDEERWIPDPAPRLPRFYKPGEGFFWDLDMEIGNVRLDFDIDMTYQGKGLFVHSIALPAGEDDLGDCALLLFREQGEIYEDGTLKERSYQNRMEAMAPGRGMVWEHSHEYVWEEWEGHEIEEVVTFVIDEVFNWGKDIINDDPYFISELDINGIRNKLSVLPLAENVEDLKKTGGTRTTVIPLF